MSVSGPGHDGPVEQEPLEELFGTVFDLAGEIASRISRDQVEARLRRTLEEAAHHQEPRPARKAVCLFCQEKVVYIDYKDTSLLRKFISDRGKIRARRVTGNCTRHQRDVATAIRAAREMSMLPTAHSYRG